MEISTSLISITAFLDGPLNMEVFQNYEVMLGQTMNYFVWNSVILCSVTYFVSYLSYWFIKGVLNISDTKMAGKKYLRLYWPIYLFIFRIYNMG
jgi:hypothetical protein